MGRRLRDQLFNLRRGPAKVHGHLGRRPDRAGAVDEALGVVRGLRTSSFKWLQARLGHELLLRLRNEKTELDDNGTKDYNNSTLLILIYL